MKNYNFNIGSCCSEWVQDTPTTNYELLNMSFEDCKNQTLPLVETYIKNNSYLEYENIIIPKHNPYEIREIAKLKERIAKEKSLPRADTDLINSTPYSQNVNHMLGTKNSVTNFAFVNKTNKELKKIGVFMINLSEYAIVFNPSDSIDRKREVLFILVDTLNKMDELDLTPGILDESCTHYNKIKPTILFSVGNLGYDITREEYNNLYIRRNEINNNYIILTAIDLGFNVKLLFKDDISTAE